MSRHARITVAFHEHNNLREGGKNSSTLKRKGASLELRAAGRYKATWKGTFKLPWREAGPPGCHDDEVDSDQGVVSISFGRAVHVPA